MSEKESYIIENETHDTKKRNKNIGAQELA